MKTKLPLTALFAAFCIVSQAVEVKEGDFTFSLESVKKIKDLMESGLIKNPNLRLVGTISRAMCTHPALPEEFKPLCRSKKANMSMYRLAIVAHNSDICEICAFAACTGC